MIISKLYISRTSGYSSNSEKLPKYGTHYPSFGGHRFELSSTQPDRPGVFILVTDLSGVIAPLYIGESESIVVAVEAILASNPILKRLTESVYFKVSPFTIDRRQIVEDLVENYKPHFNIVEDELNTSLYKERQLHEAQIKSHQAELLKLAGGELTADQVKNILGLPSMNEVDHLRLSKEIIAVEVSGVYVYPAGQFCESAIIDGISNIVRECEHLDPFVVVEFLVTPDTSLLGKSPLDVLKLGQKDAVLRLIRAAMTDEFL